MLVPAPRRSPSIKYAELDFYAKPQTFQHAGVTHQMRLALQCRQKPGFSVCGETIGWERRFGTARISAHFRNDKIERFTKARSGRHPILPLRSWHTP